MDKNKKEYLDREAFRLIEFICEKEEAIKQESAELKGSLGEMNTIDISAQIIGPSTSSTCDVFDQEIEKWKKFNNTLIGFNKVNYTYYKKFIDCILKDKTISTLVSYSFIDKYTFDWFVKSYKEKKCVCDFTTYIMELINDSIKEWETKFLLLYINIEKPIKIGSVEINYFPKDCFSFLENSDANALKILREKYVGRVYAKCVVRAEKEKAIEIGRELCLQAIDVLKICSPTLRFPQLEINFDIDMRAKMVQSSEIFISFPNSEEVTITQINNVIPFLVGNHEFEIMKINNLEVYNNFLLSNSGRTSTELESLLFNSIRRFGNAISNENKHQRVVELFTIMESLLLPNTNSPIIDSLTKYCPKIITKNVTDRNHITDLIKNMYGIRSGLIHHAKENKLSMKDLSNLQLIVNSLICNLIVKTNNYQEKKDILNEIDEAINAV